MILDDKKKSSWKNFLVVKFWSYLVKSAIFGAFWFWPHPYFGRKQTNYQNIFSRPPSVPNPCQKIFGDHPTKNEGKNSKSYPPPYRPYWGGGGSVWNSAIWKHTTFNALRQYWIKRRFKCWQKSSKNQNFSFSKLIQKWM